MNAALVSMSADSPGLALPIRAGTHWRQELERAWRLNWFHGPVGSQEGSPPFRGSGDGSRGRGAAAVDAPLPFQPAVRYALAKVQASGSDSRGQPWSAPAGLGSSVARNAVPLPPSGEPQLLGLPRVDAEAQRPIDALDSGPVTARSVARPQERCGTVRIHVEPGERGATVWIGMDAQAQSLPAQAQAIVTELMRQIHGMPFRIATVVCNGSVVYRETPIGEFTTRRETTWPSAE